MVTNANQIASKDILAGLIQTEYFVGWTYAIDYECAYVMTNDLWKAKAHGIPHNCFLVAASFDPSKYSASGEAEREIVLLRVLESAKLPQDDDMVRTKIDYFQQQRRVFENEAERQIDDLTQNQLQFGGLKCRILGTLYMKDDVLKLGSDIESFVCASRLRVYRAHGKTLERIVNYVDPIRLADTKKEASLLGLRGSIDPFKIGDVRYTSTDRLHRSPSSERVPVFIQPSDFLARRTAVLGMTRTGKSNMIKQLVSVVKKIADKGDAKIGQIIYDINGEYANANQQDQGAVADNFPEDTVRYRMLESKGFEDLRTNFYEQITEGFGIIQRHLDENNRVTTDYVRQFVNMSLDEPDKNEKGEHNRWEVRLAAYRVLLHKAGFKAPENIKISFTANKDVREAVAAQLPEGEERVPVEPNQLTLEQTTKWFEALRNAQTSLKSTSGKGWVDDTLKILLNMIVQKSDNGAFISGHAILAGCRSYHTSKRSADVATEVYAHLRDGKIVILDLSVGDAAIRQNISKQIASHIFKQSMNAFVDGKTPPNIVIYIEEAHNLIGKSMDLQEIWPRIAKEGAKYRIALVYATQEVSSVHPNILANTENWFVTHLNNHREVKELAQFYDFADFSDSLIKAQDVGFARVKTLSGPFVIPVQIDKFSAERSVSPSESGQRRLPIST